LGQDNLPNFQLITESFLQEQMIDFGDGAYPLFYDLDGDGLKDLIVGNYGYFFTQSEFIGKVAYLKNTGTIESPEFTLITDDLAQISQYGFFNVYPTLGDLNGNGKPELLIGDGQGSLHLFDLQNFNGDFPVFTLNQGNYFGIVNNAFAAPELYDVNNDGLLDILCGGRNGKIAYYENKGNASTPQFLSMPDDSDFGQINVVDNTVSFNGYSHPRVFEWNDERHLFVGSFSGRIFHYIIKNQEVISQPTPLSFSHEGIRVAAAFADLNNNGLPSFVLGNFAGGLSFYNVESFFIGINEQELKPNFDISFFPNPASDFIFLKEKGGNILWEIVTLDGKVIAQGDYSNSIINVSNLKSGIYFLKTIRNGKVMVEKMIKR
jgi:hypothetical protein